MLLEAYQALVFAQKLQQGCSPETGRQSRAKLVDFSALGAAGAKIRHAPKAELRKWAVEKYRAKKWNSANEASHALTGEVVAYGVTIGAFLKPSNAQRTIYSWFLNRSSRYAVTASRWPAGTVARNADIPHKVMAVFRKEPERFTFNRGKQTWPHNCKPLLLSCAASR